MIVENKDPLETKSDQDTLDRGDLEDTLLKISVAPRVTPDAIEANIIAEHYFTAYEARMGAIVQGTYHSIGSASGSDKDLQALKLLTFCVLTLANGYTVQGMSACASPANFNFEVGKEIARRNAVSQIWALMGYELRTKLDYQETMNAGDNDDLLGQALTRLVAASMGNSGALTPNDASAILAEMIPVNVESNARLARICHEANRSWCELNGDTNTKPWGNLPKEVQDSMVSGVAFVRANPDAGDDAQHNEWMRSKLEAGWVYGPEKDFAAKTHPCLVPFEELPHMDQFKDKLFRSLVLASIRNPLSTTNKLTPPLALVK